MLRSPRCCVHVSRPMLAVFQVYPSKGLPGLECRIDLRTWPNYQSGRNVVTYRIKIHPPSRQSTMACLGSIMVSLTDT